MTTIILSYRIVKRSMTNERTGHINPKYIHTHIYVQVIYKWRQRRRKREERRKMHPILSRKFVVFNNMFLGHGQ